MKSDKEQRLKGWLALITDMAEKCNDRGRSERCLLGDDGYPVTKNGRLSCFRVRDAPARGRQQRIIEVLHIPESSASAYYYFSC
jgi:hypothetical protein